MKYKILIVEDDAVIQKELKALLTGHGYEVQAVEDFGHTLDLVKDFSPHLILLDIKLPTEGGFSICAKIRSFSSVPIVFVTSLQYGYGRAQQYSSGWGCFSYKAV